MKGFIELTIGSSKISININNISSFYDNRILLKGREYFDQVEETYEEIKQLIINSQK